MTDSAYVLRDVEKRILRELQANGRIANVELADRVGLSESPCLRRVRALEQAGVITGYRAMVDARRLGLDVVAYIHVNLDLRTEADTKRFLDAVQAEERIVECSAMSGSYDYLLKVLATTIEEYADLTMHHILRYAGVKDISSAFVLKEMKKTRTVPL